MKGRGATSNPPNRFVRLTYNPDPEQQPDDFRTELYRDATRSIIAYNDSPDVGFVASINPYRGCEHGCAYCFARPTHEYLGFSAGLDFETRIMVKEDAPELLRRELRSPSYKPQPIAISGVTDAYQPVERRLQLTRRCLEVLAEARNPVGIVTKSQLVTRDIDLLCELARFNAAAVFLSITTLDATLAAKMEPRAASPANRLAAIEALAQAGIPVGVLAAPIIPGLTDHEIVRIITEAAKAGATFAGYTIVRLPLAVGEIFEQWLEEHFPARKQKVLNRIRSIRDGKLNNPEFGARMRGDGVFAEQIRKLFKIACRKAGISGMPELSTASFRRPSGNQPTLFDL
ncbi:MAG TPA: PA0069 family radical SAM protein [Blastocatellia bacterium]|nr:PA0069 family radical SAM protein [Blastocatellia bacterium]